MATFRGTVQGDREETSRLGSSRMRTEAQSWEGKVVTILSIDPGTGEILAQVSIEPHYGKRRHVILYNGPIAREENHYEQ